MTENDYIEELKKRWPRTAKTKATMEAITLADEATRAFPHSPKLWCMRGNLMDHPVSQQWLGFSYTNTLNFIKCLSRDITVRQKGTDRAVELAPSYLPSQEYYVTNGIVAHPYMARTQASFMIRSVLDAKQLILTSSDLTRIKVTRREQKTGKVQEWILDCSDAEHAPAFWLRDGDVVEIPERSFSQNSFHPAPGSHP